MPTFLTADGRAYTTDVPAEVTKLRMSRKYSEQGVTPVTVVDTQFHPGDASAAEVKAYIQEHPEQADRIISEEKAGKRRGSIIGE